MFVIAIPTFFLSPNKILQAEYFKQYICIAHICEGWEYNIRISACLVQVSSVAQSCSTLCNPMDRSMPGLPAHHQLPEFTQ